MILIRRLGVGLSVIALQLAACSAFTQDSAKDHQPGSGSIKRVLLISVDGMHAVDFLNCANGISGANQGDPYCPALAALAKHGVNYVDASTSKPSDSSPGLTSLITGGSPALTGSYCALAYPP